jgi:hypothetical protein
MAEINPKELCPCGSGKTFGDCHLPHVKHGPPPITEHIRLRVIPEPDPNTRAVFTFTGEGTLGVTGEASGLSMDCGGCGSALIQGVAWGDIRGIVIKCNNCGRYNETW